MAEGVQSKGPLSAHVHAGKGGFIQQRQAALQLLRGNVRLSEHPS